MRSPDSMTFSDDERHLMNLLNRFVREEAGQDIIEYALLAAFVSIVAWALLANIGTSVNSIYTKVNSVADKAQSQVP
jgi:Flp pilus assembly pilin Flp